MEVNLQYFLNIKELTIIHVLRVGRVLRLELRGALLL